MRENNVLWTILLCIHKIVKIENSAIFHAFLGAFSQHGCACARAGRVPTHSNSPSCAEEGGAVCGGSEDGLDGLEHAELLDLDEVVREQVGQAGDGLVEVLVPDALGGQHAFGHLSQVARGPQVG